MTPTPDTQAAIAFLSAFHPETPWVVTAIEVDRKGIETATFSGTLASRRASAAEWVERRNGRQNLYFMVNPPRRELTSKAAKTDVAALAWLHVDVDPRAEPGLDLAQEQARIHALLAGDAYPRGMPEPSFVVFTGGGYAAFYRLREPVPLRPDDVAHAEELERYNKHLELVFGGDHCFNIDRIMRLPGTVNLPDAKKLKKGRVPALAHVVAANSTYHSLAQFKQTAKPERVHTALAAAPTVAAPTETRRLESVDDLDQWAVPDRVKVVIVQGHDPDNPKADDNSRSAWVFDVTCQLVRARVPDDVIFSVLTDESFRISDSVLECGSNAERYALRQIQRAHEETQEPWLRGLNKQHAVIGNYGGKCVVVEEVLPEDGTGRPYLSAQSFEAFAQRYMNRQVEAGKKADGSPLVKPMGRAWLEHAARREYDRVVFMPGREVSPRLLNLWRGWAVEPATGSCERFLAHVRDVLCSGNERHAEWLLNWMAHAVQKPYEQGHIAVVLRGGKGVGKGSFTEYLGALFGRHYLSINNSKHLVGAFNAHLRDVVLLFADEAFYAGDRQHEATLKALITESHLTIEGKGRDAERSPNHLHIVIASNNEWVVPAGHMERRFFMLDVGASRQQDKTYFKALADERDSGGAAALLHMLLARDISAFDPRTAPSTRALLSQKALSLESWEALFVDALHAGVTFDGPEWKGDWGPEWMSVEALVERLPRDEAESQSIRTRVGNFLKTQAVPGTTARLKKRTQRADRYAPAELSFRRLWRLRPLDRLRGEWSDRVEQWLEPDRVAWAMDVDEPLPVTDPRQEPLLGSNCASAGSDEGSRHG